MSDPFSSMDVDTQALDAPSHSRPTTAFSDLGLVGVSAPLNRAETYSAASSSTSRLPTKHTRSQTEGQFTNRSLGRLSKLLGTVLNSPFTNNPTTNSTPTRSRMAVAQSRSPSPSPSVEYSMVSAPSVPNTPQGHSAPLSMYSSRNVTSGSPTISLTRSMLFYSSSKNASASSPTSTLTASPGKTSGKRILPRLWTALSSPTKETGIRFKRKGKGKGKGKATDNGPSGDYPLDGEEGELIDDEACFVDSTVGIDIISRLPPEIALYLLVFLDLPSILVCLGVSHSWRRLASDPMVWRSLFHAAPGWEINNDLAQRRLTPTPSNSRVRRTNSIISVATSFRNEVDATIGRVRRLQTPPATPTQFSGGVSPPGGGLATSHRQSVSSTNTSFEMVMSPGLAATSIPEGALAPLTLDWQALYKTRFEIERRVCGIPYAILPSVSDKPSLGTEPRVMKLSGHLDSVYCLEFDANKIVTGSRDTTIKVWSLTTGKLKSTLRGHEGSVLCLKFDASGFMVSGSSDRRILVWDLARGEVRKVLAGHQGGVLDIRVDKRWIVSCSKDAVIQVWDRTSLKPHCSLHGHDGPVNAVGLQDGRIVSASGDGRMILWDIATASKIRTFDGHDRGLACIEFKDDYICSGSNDWKIKVWSASTGECLRTLTGHTALVRALSFNPRTGRLISGSYDKTVKMWDIHSGTMLREFRNAHDSHIFDVKFDPSHIVSTSHDQKIVVLDWSYGLDASLFV